MIEDIIAQAVRLALSGGVPLWVVLGLILASAVLLVLARRLPPVKPEVPPPPAEWGENDTPGSRDGEGKYDGG